MMKGRHKRRWRWRGRVRTLRSKWAHELEMRRSEVTKSDKQASAKQNGGAKTPRLSQFQDRKESMDAYLMRFNIFIKLQQWAPGQWALYLSALMT